MKKEKAAKNIIVSLIFKFILIIFNLLTRRYLLSILGAEATGVYSLYVSIIGFLAVAELGVGSAITFSMYKPIVDGDKDQISGLYFLYKKIYRIVLTIMLFGGIALTPFLPNIAKNTTGNINLYTTYIIFLFSTLLPYLFAHKTSFIEANMDNYYTITISSLGKIIESILQITLLILTKSFDIFLISILISNIFKMLTTNILYNKKYRHLINGNKVLSSEVRFDVNKRTKAMFSHKIGGVLVMTVDSVIISAFIGVGVLGLYTNYKSIVDSMAGILGLVFSSIVSILGHSYASNTKAVYHNQFKQLYLINYIITFIFYLGYFSVIDGIIGIIFGTQFIIDKDIVIVITLNYYIQFMRQVTMSFKDASGTFYNDRYKPLLEGITNLILSLILVQFFGIIGVLVATIITNLFITHIIEPYVLYKYAFGDSPKNYYFTNYAGIAIFTLALFIFNLIPFPTYSNLWIDVLVKGSASVFISSVVLMIIYLTNKNMRKIINNLVKSILYHIKKRRNHEK